MNTQKTTNTLLLIIVIPVIFYLLKILSFIFIPLVAAMFISLLFLPIMRWMKNLGVPNVISLIIIVVILIATIRLGGYIVQLSVNEIINTDKEFVTQAQSKLLNIIVGVEKFLGIERLKGTNVIKHYINKDILINNVSITFDYISKTLSLTIMTSFFVILLLANSINFQQIFQKTIFKGKHASTKAFMRIEKDILKFMKVKFVISLFTGIGFTIACLLFDVKFPVFWGLFAFLINYVQMVGSFISVIVLALFVLIQLEPTGSLLIFILMIISVQVIMGGVLEPIFMGKTFSINVISVLIMLTFWGYIWGIPGMIMSIPITVFLKIIFEQFQETKIISELLSGK